MEFMFQEVICGGGMQIARLTGDLIIAFLSSFFVVDFQSLLYHSVSRLEFALAVIIPLIRGGHLSISSIVYR